jgi:hypothetical protein
MRVLLLAALIGTVSLPITAGEPVWKIDLRQRAVRRADPGENARRHAAAVAKGRQAAPPDVNVIEGSYDPAVLAPIELIAQIYPVYNLEPERRERFRREWKSRGAAELLGKDWWERLRVVLARPIFLDHESRRIHTLPVEEQKALAAIKARRPPKQHSDDGECEAEAEALKAARALWGETFDRFLYEAVAPGVYFWTSSSDPTLMTDPEHWLEEWRYREVGCR